MVFERICAKLGPVGWSRIRTVLLLAALFSVFWFFRSATFRGDGDIIARFMETRGWLYEREVFLHFLLVAAYRLLQPWHLSAMQVMNIFSCVAAVVFFLILVRLLRDWLGDAFPGCCLLLASGYAILFAGYTEYYAPVIAVMLLFFERTFRYLRDEAPLWHVLWVFALFASFHMIAFFAFPGLFYLIWRARIAVDFRRQLVLGLTPLALLTILVWWNPFLPSVISLDIGSRLCPLFDSPNPSAVPLFSREHLVGWFYWQFKACLPGLPMVALFLSRDIRRKVGWSPFHSFLVLCAAGFLAFSIVWNPDIGIAADWDLFAVAVLPYAFLGLSAWNASSGWLRRAIWVLLIPSAVWTWSYIVIDAKLGHRGRGALVVRGVESKACQIKLDGHQFGPVIHGLLEGTHRIRVINMTDGDAWHGLVDIDPNQTTFVDYRPGMPDDPRFEAAFREASPAGK